MHFEVLMMFRPANDEQLYSEFQFEREADTLADVRKALIKIAESFHGIDASFQISLEGEDLGDLYINDDIWAWAPMGLRNNPCPVNPDGHFAWDDELERYAPVNDEGDYLGNVMFDRGDGITSRDIATVIGHAKLVTGRTLDWDIIEPTVIIYGLSEKEADSILSMPIMETEKVVGPVWDCFDDLR